MTAANQAQNEAWNGESGHQWVADADRRDAVLAPVADALLIAAHLEPGAPVLDIGCGCGVTTLDAARAVQLATVTGVDLSGPMLDLARQRATGFDNVRFIQADAQTYHFERDSYDIVISRFGTMFFDEPVAAFANLVAAMRPKGRLCIATWQPLATNDWLLVPGAVLSRYGSLPYPSGNEPGMFAQSEPTEVSSVLERAGWRDIAVEPVTIPLRLGRDAADATDYIAGTGIARGVLDTLAEADRETAIAAVSDALATRAGADGVTLDAGVNLISATI